MRRGRPYKHAEPSTEVISLRLPPFYRSVMRALKVEDSDVYLNGYNKIVAERLGDCPIEVLQGIAQETREEIKQLQEFTNLIERTIMDIETMNILQERKRKKTEAVRDPDSGKVCLVVDAE